MWISPDIWLKALLWSKFRLNDGKMSKKWRMKVKRIRLRTGCGEKEKAFD